MPRYASNVQIPNLPVAVALSGAEEIEIVQSGQSRRATTQQIANLTQISIAPNYTTTQKNVLVVSTGALVFDTDLQKLCVYTNSGWQTISSS
jgi:hypothetical protein